MGERDGLDLFGGGLGRRVLADDARVAQGRCRGLEELDPVRACDDGRVRHEHKDDETAPVEEEEEVWHRQRRRENVDAARGAHRPVCGLEREDPIN